MPKYSEMREQVVRFLPTLGSTKAIMSKISNIDSLVTSDIIKYKKLIALIYSSIYGVENPDTADSILELKSSGLLPDLCDVSEIEEDTELHVEEDTENTQLDKNSTLSKNPTADKIISNSKFHVINEIEQPTSTISSKVPESSKVPIESAAKHAVNKQKTPASSDHIPTKSYSAFRHKKNVDGLSTRLGVVSSSDKNRIIKYKLYDGALSADFPFHSYVYDSSLCDRILLGAYRSSDQVTMSNRGARIDITRYWLNFTSVSGDNYYIPYSFPYIPECQSDVTVTTDFSKMLDLDYAKLYPNVIYRIRPRVLYTNPKNYDIEIDQDLGWIPSISGFTRKEVISNILQYPSVEFMQRDTDTRNYEPFSRKIEISGELLPTSFDTLSELEDLNCISIDPTNTSDVLIGSVFYSEYVCRRYLLECSKGVKHISDVVGKLNPFMIINMPYKMYQHIDTMNKLNLLKSFSEDSLIKVGMKNRQDYLRSINPIIREARRAGVSLPS